MSRKAQALLELALFVGIMLMVLLAALNYQRSLREQKATDKNVFDQSVNRAYNEKFQEEDINGNTWTYTGAIVSYNLNVDRQANRIFQGGQRRTTGSSASVYWSGAEAPQNRDFSYYNNTDIGPEVDTALKKKIYYDRPGNANPQDDLTLSAADYISIAYPIVYGFLQGQFNLVENFWWVGWANIIIRAGLFANFISEYNNAIDRMNATDTERDALAEQDKEMGEWGWRVPDWVHDRKELCPGMTKDQISECEAILGKKYVKEITAQMYDVETEEPKSIDHNETQQAAPAGYTSSRRVTVGHKVNRKISRRFDETAPDSTIPLSGHNFTPCDTKEVTVDLSGSQSETWN